MRSDQEGNRCNRVFQGNTRDGNRHTESNSTCMYVCVMHTYANMERTHTHCGLLVLLLSRKLSPVAPVRKNLTLWPLVRAGEGEETGRTVDMERACLTGHRLRLE